MAAEHAAVVIDDVAWIGGARHQAFDYLGVAAGRDKADILAVVLVGHRQREPAGEFARFGLGLVAERKPQHGKLLARGGEQEVALVALFLAGTIERTGTVRLAARGHIVAGRQYGGTELARGTEQVGELNGLVTVHAGNRGLTGHIALREAVDHRLPEPVLIVQDVMRDADPCRNGASVIDILAGATGPLAVGRCAVVVELQGDPDDVVAFGLEQRRVTDKLTPPDMATTTRVSSGRPSISSELSIALL